VPFINEAELIDEEVEEDELLFPFPFPLLFLRLVFLGIN
jgi:hypothetical protein